MHLIYTKDNYGAISILSEKVSQSVQLQSRSLVGIGRGAAVSKFSCRYGGCVLSRTGRVYHLRAS